MTNYEREKLAIARATLALIDTLADTFSPMSKTEARAVLAQLGNPVEYAQ